LDEPVNAWRESVTRGARSLCFSPLVALGLAPIAIFFRTTLVILALCNVYHYHAQGFLIATTSINQISRVFDEASTSLGGSFVKTLWDVILPIIAPSIISVGVFFFVRSMVTLSAVIFLVTPQTQVAAVSVLLLDDAGNANQAAAFSVCIMLVVALALLLFQLALRMSGRKSISLMR